MPFGHQEQSLDATNTSWPGEDEPGLLVEVTLNGQHLDARRSAVRPHQPTVQQQGHRGAVIRALEWASRLRAAR